MNKNLITGFFGVNNLGDDIMLDSFYDCLANKDSVSLLQLYKGGKIITPIDKKNISMFPHGKRLLIDRYYSRIYKSLFWIGGTCMTDSFGDGIYRYMNSFKNKNKKIGYIGIGINEIHNKERRNAYKDILDKADMVTLRDEKSYAIAKSLSKNPNIILTEDLVYLNNKIVLKAENRHIRKLLVSWRNLEGYYSKQIEEKAIKSLIEAIKKHSEDYDEIIITTLGNRVDIDINRKIFANLSMVFSHVRYLEELNCEKRIELILSATTVITGRLHGIFISEWNNINTIAIGYDEKVVSFLESIGRTNDLVYPDAFDVDAIEDALMARRVKLTHEDWDKKRVASMRNVELFESII